MNETTRIHSVVQREFPDIEIHSISEIGEGEDSKAYLINETHIFRFPKREKIRASLKTEIAVLPKIRTALNLAIPDFEYVSGNANFVGYRMIEGSCLTKDLFYSFPVKTQNKIQNTLSEFLKALHATDLTSLAETGIETYEYRETYREYFLDIKRYIYPQLSVQDQEYVTNRFSTYLDNPDNFNYKPALLHNDFSADHILIDTTAHKIKGIIDFGDMSVGDPDYDLKYFPQEYGNEFLISFLKFYDARNPKLLLEKINFINLGDILESVLVGQANNNKSQVKHGMKSLKIWLKRERTEIFITKE